MKEITEIMEKQAGDDLGTYKVMDGLMEH